VNLSSRLDEVLQVCSCEEVAEVHKFAVVGILNIYNTPAVLATTYGLALDDYIVLGTNNSERDDLLEMTT